MSQDSSHSKTIDGHTYTIYMLAPSTSLALLADLGKLLGPALGSSSELFTDGKEVSDNKFFVQAASSVLAGLDKDFVQKIVDTLLTVSQVDGKQLKPIWEIHFMGKIGTLLKWLVFALKAQYSDFSSAWEGIVQAGQVVQMPFQSQSQNISTG